MMKGVAASDGTKQRRCCSLLYSRMQHCVKSIQLFRQTCGAWVEDDRVQSVILGAIVTNAIMLGIGTFEFEDPTILVLLDGFDLVFLILFTVELFLHLLHKGIRPILRDGWMCFDALVILMSWSLEKFQIARAVRIIRAVRLVTHLESLRGILAALLRVLPRLYSVVGLFVIMLYIYSVLCTELFGDLFARGLTDADYFGTLSQSMFTLFQFMTAEDWNEIARQVIRQYYWARFVFGTFVVITNFVLYSLLAAVFCHAVTTPDKEVLESLESLHRIQAAVEQAYERQIMVLCQCQILMPKEDLAVFSPQRRSKKLQLSKQKSFTLQTQQKSLSIPRLSLADVESFPGNASTSTLSVVSKDIIEYGEEQFKKVLSFRGRCQEFVEDVRFQALSASIVLLNAVVLGIETFDFVDDSPLTEQVFNKINRGCLVLFSLELGLNLYIAETWKRVVCNPWLCFDLVIVAVCWAVESLSVARALRVIRVFQLGRRFKPLQGLVEALVGSAPSISGVLILFGLIVYIFSVFCTVLFGELFDLEGVTEHDYFGRLDKTAFTLFQMLTLEGWGGIAREVESEYPWAWAVFCSYLVLTSAILFSMIIGYMTDAVKGSGYVPKRELDQRVRHLHRQVQSLKAQQSMLLRSLKSCIQQKRTERAIFHRNP